MRPKKIMGIFVLALTSQCWGGQLLSSATSDALCLDTTVVANSYSYVTVSHAELPVLLTYSASNWDGMTMGEGGAKLSVDDELICEMEGEGVVEWMPSKSGIYTLAHEVNGLKITKGLEVVSVQIAIERVGLDKCRMMASDGVSQIRYTTDGSEPTEESALYTEQFVVPMSRLTCIKACSFVGGFRGRTETKMFEPRVLPMASAETLMKLDTRAGRGDLPVDGVVGITWSSLWSADETATAVVKADGSVLSSSAGEGVVSYYPSAVGSYVLMHQTVKNGMSVGETLTATVNIMPLLSKGVVIGGVAQIAEGTAEIADGAFANRTGLTSVTIPNGVTNIAATAFAGCENIASVGFNGWPNMVHLCKPEMSGWLALGDDVYQTERQSQYSQTLVLKAEVAGPKCTSFRWKATYSGNYLRYYIDGVQQSYLRYSSADWQEVRLDIPAGRHEIKWEYYNSSSYGDYYGWVDLSGWSYSAPAELSRLFPDSYASIRQVSIGSGVTSIGADAFLGCENLKRVDVESLDVWRGIEFANDGANPLNLGAALYVNGERIDFVRVTFDTNDGESVTVRSLPAGEAIGELPCPVCGKDEFLGWFTEPSGGEKIDESHTVSGDVTFYGHWRRADGGPYKEVYNGVTWTFMVVGGYACVGADSYSQAAVDTATAGELKIPDELGGRMVSEIGDYAFYGCSELTSVIMSTNVTSVGRGAFCYCTGLSDINIPSSVTSVGDNAFAGCTGVTNLVVNTTADSKCSWIKWFTDCRGIKMATVPGSSSVIVNYPDYSTISQMFPELEELAFTEGTLSIPLQMCYGLTTLIKVCLPSSLLAIGDSAFYGCGELKEVAIPTNVTSIGQSAFYDCVGLCEINIPSSVTDLGYGAFRGCTGVTNLVIDVMPDSNCRWMEAFSGCLNVKTATVPGSSSSSVNSPSYSTMSRLFPELEKLTFTEDTVSIPYRMCAGLTRLTQVNMPSTLKAIGGYAFSECASLVSADVPGTVTSMGRCVFSGCEKLVIESLYVDGGIGSIFPEEYYGMAGIKNVVIGEGIYQIGNSAFEGCSGMTNVVFPSSLQSIGSRAFANCSGLAEITFPGNAPRVASEAFSDCTNLISVTISGGYLWPEENSFANCVNITSVTILGDGCVFGSPFADCVNLTQLNVHIGSSSPIGRFDGFCTPMTVNVLPSCTGLPGGCFNSCSFIKELNLPEGLEYIGEWAVGYCTALEVVNFPSSLKEIEYDAFGGCSSLRKAVLPEGLLSIGELAFYDCTQLETPIHIPNSVTNIGVRAFYGHDVADLQFDADNKNYVVENGVLYKLENGVKAEVVMVSDSMQGDCVIQGTVKRIGVRAFDGCKDIDTIVLPEGLEEIGGFAFSGCDRLVSLNIPASVYALEGSAIRDLPFDAISIASGNPVYYRDGQLIYRKVDAARVELIGVDRHYTGGLELEENVVGIGDYCFAYCGKLESVGMDENLMRIGSEAFMYCSNLVSVVVPENVETIGTYAFEYCGRLESVDFGERVTSVGNGAFMHCTNLVAVVIPENVETVGGYAFEYCTALTRVDILGGSLSGSSTFYGCTALEEVYIGPRVSKIPSSAFSGCDSLKRIKIDSVAELGANALYSCDGLESADVRSSAIGNSAFEYCKSLTSVILSEGVETVGAYAFYGCSGLEELSISSSVTNIGSSAFYDCSSLKAIHVSSDADLDAVKQMLAKSGLDVESVTFDLFDEPIAMPLVSPPDGTVFKATNCLVSISCASVSAAIYFRIGAAPKASSRFLYSEPFTITETSTIYSYAMRNGRSSSTNVVTLTKGCLLTFAEAASTEGIASFDVGGDADWVAVNDEDAKVGDASVRSGGIGDDQVSWFSAKVEGPGTVSFWWKASCEWDVFHEYDHLVFAVDDEEVALLDGITDWEQVSVQLGDGSHMLYWLYEKDESDRDGEDCGWVDGIVWMPSGSPAVTPTIEGDEGATVTGDVETGFVVKPSEGNTAVEVTIPQGVDAAKVTVELSPKVASVKPNGAKVKIISGDADITEFLDVPTADGNGVVDLTKATVKEEIVKEALDVEKGAEIELNAANPSLTTSNTRIGLLYTFSEGRTLGGMERSASKTGDGKPWSPEIKVKDGNSAFYSIGVGKGE